VSASLLLIPPNTRVELASSISLSCTARGYPLPAITWLKDGLTLVPGELINITITVLTNISSSPNITVLSILDICDLRLSDSGLYECSANNTIATNTAPLSSVDTAQFNLTVLSECISYRTAPLSNVTAWFSLTVLSECISLGLC